MKSRLLLFALTLWGGSCLWAGDLWLPAIISDNMVLQSGTKVPVWGMADPAAGVSVSLGDQTRPTAANGEGKWLVYFDSTKFRSGEPLTMIASADNGDSITVKNIVVGEVWLASGQSNMEFMLKNAIGAKEEAARPAHAQLRQFLVKNSANPKPVTETEGRWVLASPTTVGEFSAVGYFFAKRLQEELKVPVGLIHSSWGASALESWVSAESLDSVDFLKVARERFWQLEQADPTRPAAKKWDMTVPLTAQGLTPQKKPAFLFNGMIYPLIPYAIRGVIWYQGEGNSSRAGQYRTAFPLLIKDWRGQWKQGDFPFYFCQLANFRAKEAQPGDSEWAELREAQTMTLQVPNTGQAVLIDLGEAEDIHPRHKLAVGERLARIALARDYGKAVVYEGPRYQSMSIEQNKIRLRFNHCDGGLVAKALPATYDLSTLKGTTAPLTPGNPQSQLQGFAISGTDGKWVWAEAGIDGDSVVVSAFGIDKPVAVRYAWVDNPTGNLYNGAGLPAVPFRTDDYPLTMGLKEY